MAISPIAIATHGLLNSPLSVAAVRGHLTVETATGGGGFRFGARGRWKHPQLELDRLQVQIEREDEEILAVIMAFTELMNKWRH